jgi:hypothetical protein
MIATKPATQTFEQAYENRSADGSSARTATLLIGGNSIGTKVPRNLEDQVA